MTVDCQPLTEHLTLPPSSTVTSGDNTSDHHTGRGSRQMRIVCPHHPDDPAVCVGIRSHVGCFGAFASSHATPSRDAAIVDGSVADGRTASGALGELRDIRRDQLAGLLGMRLEQRGRLRVVTGLDRVHQWAVLLADRIRGGLYTFVELQQ